jgi:tetratricopeptide (TPR) repeat protein
MAVASPPTAHASAAAGASFTPATRARTPWALLIALLAATGYAAFAEGATRLPQESWLQLALLALVVLASGAGLYGGGVRPTASPLAWAGVLLLAAFAVWTGVTILWSVAPDRTWIELNRAIAYVVTLVLAIGVGSSLPRASERAARGLAILVVPVALYALGGKTLPGLKIDGLINLDHAGALTRLRAPFGYWNALALFCVIATFPMLRLAADPLRSAWRRMAALGGVYLLVTILGMTYSRGGILAFVAGMTAFVALTTERVRTVVLLWVAMIGATVPLTIALTAPDLITNTVPVERRTDDALIVLIAFLIALAFVAGAGRAVIAMERARPFTAQRGRRFGRIAVIAAVGLIGLGTVNAVATGALSDAADRFTDTQEGGSLTDPNRLLSTNSGNRWTWWKEAVGAWSDKPVAGWGAGSFPVTHDLYRTRLLPVQQPHSVPLQFLAETGLVGALLALGGLLALLAAAVARVRETEWRLADAPAERGYAAALVAAPVAWLAHCVYDWDWDIPAVTLPMLIALGVVVARPARLRPVLAPRPGEEGVRAVAFGLGTLAVVVAVVSAGLPAFAQTQTSAALEAVGKAKLSAGELALAAADAELAAKLNPLAVEPLFAGASIAERRGNVGETRRQLLRALQRQPDNVEAWLRLARVDGVLRLDRAGLRRASERALELDPLNPAVFALARRAEQALVGPNESATATGSPLPKQVPVTDPDPVPAPTP